MLTHRSVPLSISGGALVLALLAFSPPVTTAPLTANRSSTSPRQVQEVAPEKGANRDELRVRIEGLVTRVLEQPGAVGLSVAVAIGDEFVLAGGHGIAEVEHDVPVNVDTMFRIGSVTKQFTAAAVMRLVEKGEVELDELITAYLSDYPTQGHEVTVLHLLTHTSGIKSYTGLGPDWQRRVSLDLSHQELLALFKDEPFDFAPGERFLYNNSGYYLLGMIIEEVTGQSYADHLQT